MMYICSMFLSCLCNCALFVFSSHVEEIKNFLLLLFFNGVRNILSNLIIIISSVKTFLEKTHLVVA